MVAQVAEKLIEVDAGFIERYSLFSKNQLSDLPVVMNFSDH